MEDTKAKCIDFLQAHDWELWDGETSFSRGYAKARRAGGSSYVVVKRIEGRIMVVKDFEPSKGAISGFDEVYCSEKRQKTAEEESFDLKALRGDSTLLDHPVDETKPFDVNDLKTIPECRAYLKSMGLSNMAKGNKSYEQLMKIIKDNL